MTSQHCIFWTFITLFILLINLTGQSCQLIDSTLLKQISSISVPSSSSLPATLTSPLLSSLSPSADSSEVSRDSTILISNLNPSSLSPSTSSATTSSQSIRLPSDTNKLSDTFKSLQFNHELKRKRYQPARYLVKPLWLNPKYTWKVLQMNSSRNDAKQAEMRKLREKKRAKICKLADKMKQATIVSKKLYLLLNEISMSLSD
ncbi:uncharacterized protein LOC107368305 [Tetranychus urticae]|uniref:BZIP domain-containing protein n=1 Tax=Tetranychus urticae TaxID=32264 RepID=T1KY11_TETUR|nr:uncharacterized protein LOC107368305 [Tetranychus urticae]